MKLKCNKDTVIRKARKDEYKKIYNLVKEAFYDYRRGKDNPSLVETPEDVLSDINNNTVLILEIKNEIAGSVRLEKKDTEKYYLKKFAISPDFQGQGFGSILIDKAESIIKKAGGVSVYLHSSIEEKDLLKFYKNRGFKCIKTDKSMGYKRGLLMKNL